MGICEKRIKSYWDRVEEENIFWIYREKSYERYCKKIKLKMSIITSPVKRRIEND